MSRKPRGVRHPAGLVRVNEWEVLKMKIRPRPRKAESNGVGGSAGHFSKSERSGAPPVISVNVKRQTRVILPR
jgi:hypothetical protein